MIVLEYNEVEVDYCAACGGVWLDAGELELLFGDRAMCEGFMSAGAGAGSGEKPRRCPICRCKMAKEGTGGDHPVVYDRCRRGDGLWFDRGELALVLQHGSPAPGGEAVGQWLREMFAERGPETVEQGANKTGG